MKTLSETYNQMDKRHKEELSAFDGLFWAFNKNQLAEGLQKVGLAPDDYKAIVSIGGGGYLRKDRVTAFEDMFDRHRQEKRLLRQNKETIKIKFIGVDGWNRPVFRTVEKPKKSKKHWFYGSVNALFDCDATEQEVLDTIDEDALEYFGSSFGCEPMGGSSGNIEIVRS